MGWGDGLTARTRSWLTGALVVLFVGNAVGLAAIDERGPARAKDDDELAALQREAGGTGGSPPESVVTAPSTTAAPAQRGSTDDAASTTTTTTTAPSGGDGYTYQVTLVPMCVVVGQDLTLTFLVEPGSAIGVIVAHADGDTHDSRWAGNAGPDGRAVRTWKAPPALGWARALTGVVTPEGRSGGTPVDFQIIEPTGTCA